MMNEIIKHIRRWNMWRKGCLNGPIHKFFVLFGIVHSPTLPSVLLPEEWAEIQDAFERGLHGELRYPSD